jgi:hypothetical protein
MAPLGKPPNGFRDEMARAHVTPARVTWGGKPIDEMSSTELAEAVHRLDARHPDLLAHRLTWRR